MGKESDANRNLLDLDDPLAHQTPPSSRANHAPRGGAPTLRPALPYDDEEEEISGAVSTLPRLKAAEAHEEIRERLPTLTNEEALETARLNSFPSHIPPPRPKLSTVPGPISSGDAPDSQIEIDAGEEDLDEIDPQEQEAILRARLHPLNRVPELAKRLTELGELLEDPKTAYVLGFVDGILPLDTIIEVTGLPELDTLKVLDRMISLGIVVFRQSFRELPTR